MTTSIPTVGSRARSWKLGYILDGIAETARDSTALIFGAERRCIGYGDLAELVVDYCATLQRGGLRPGDVVALQSTNSIEFVVALLAAARADIVVAPLDPALPSAERRARVDRVGARVILTDAHDPSLAASGDCPEWRLGTAQPSTSSPKSVMRPVIPGSARVVAAPVPGLIARDALIMFTSGTTGTPKLVPWTHDNLAASIMGIAGVYGLSSSDATVAAMPLFHGHGLIATLLATLTTGGAVVLPTRGKFSAHTFWDDVSTVNATWYTAAPTIHEILLERASVDIPRGYEGRLRFIRSCSAPLSPAVVQRMEATFNAPVLAAYGMTETTHQASTVPPSADESTRLHTVGTPTGLSVRIVDGNGESCQPGATGEICLRGPTGVRGYLDDAAATASTFADGWIRTGDLGAVDGHGTLTVQGRIKEQINRGGEKVSPEHVEDVLMSHPGVAQAAVFGSPDVLYGERVAAVAVLENGVHLDGEDLISYCREHLAPYEIPENLTFVDELPLTAKGTPDRSQLANAFGGRGSV